jgi:hypothetical protein
MAWLILGQGFPYLPGVPDDSAINAEAGEQARAVGLSAARGIDDHGDGQLEVFLRGLRKAAGSPFSQLQGTHLVVALTGCEVARRAPRRAYRLTLVGIVVPHTAGSSREWRVPAARRA